MKVTGGQDLAQEALETIIDAYVATRRARFPAERTGPDTILFVDRHGEALRAGGAQYLVGQCYRWAGIGSRVPKAALVHALRHTLATRLAEDGATATEIQGLLGHESLTTSQGYIDSTAREQRDAARANRTYRTLERITPGTLPGRRPG